MDTAIGKGFDDAEIRALIDDWSSAVRAKQAGAVARCQAAGFVHFSLAPPLQSAPTDNEDLEAWFATWEGSIGYEIHDLRIAIGGDLGFSYSLNRLSGTKIGGYKNDIWFRQTLGFRKIDGAWRIVHEHESVPFYMDGSLRAAVDLQP
jgi:ketosteroid isomerase-like protein